MKFRSGIILTIFSASLSCKNWMFFLFQKCFILIKNNSSMYTMVVWIQANQRLNNTYLCLAKYEQLQYWLCQLTKPDLLWCLLKLCGDPGSCKYHWGLKVFLMLLVSRNQTLLWKKMIQTWNCLKRKTKNNTYVVQLWQWIRRFWNNDVEMALLSFSLG